MPDFSVRTKHLDQFFKWDILMLVSPECRFAHTPEQSLSGWDQIIAVNLTGTFLMCRAVIPGMLEGGGAIVNTVSTAGVIGQPYSAAYCASKGCVKLLTKALAVEYMGRDIRRLVMEKLSKSGHDVGFSGGMPTTGTGETSLSAASWGPACPPAPIRPTVDASSRARYLAPIALIAPTVNRCSRPS